MSDSRPKLWSLNRPRWVSRVEPERYTCPDFLAKECDRLFRRAWLIAGREDRIPRPGDYFVWEEMNNSVIILRDDRGQVHGFHNTCSHRGSTLLHGSGRIRHIQCPYHSWSYKLDGTLLHLPKPEGGPDIAHEALGLKPVQCQTLGGFVWINLDMDAPGLFADQPELVADWEPYRLEEMEPIQHTRIPIDANWKAMVENVTDFYHVPAVHSRTISQHVPEGPDFTQFGDHIRQRLEIGAYGWREKLDRACSRGGPYTEKQASALHKYLVFPNTVINALPYHLTVMQFIPTESPDHCILDYAFYKRRGARGVEWLRAYATWVASRVILKEDLDIIGHYQAGLRRAETPAHHLHNEEKVVACYHGIINRWMES
jgi:choline monooxygenase